MSEVERAELRAARRCVGKIKREIERDPFSHAKPLVKAGIKRINEFLKIKLPTSKKPYLGKRDSFSATEGVRDEAEN